MNDILTTPEARIVLLLTILAVLLACGWYIVSRFRDEIKREESASDLMSKFGELRHRGHLTAAEYRTIKSVLAKSERNETRDAATPDS